MIDNQLFDCNSMFFYSVLLLDGIICIGLYMYLYILYILLFLYDYHHYVGFDPSLLESTLTGHVGKPLANELRSRQARRCLKLGGVDLSIGRNRPCPVWVRNLGERCHV